MSAFSNGRGVGMAALAIFALAPLATRGDTPAAVPSPSTSAAAGPTIDTKNFAYAPASLTVHPGDTVAFRNSDSTAHTVTATDGSFDSGNMGQGATWSHIFAKAGTYTYVCAYHSYMEGTIVVK